MASQSKSTTWRWVGVFLWLLILLILWLNGAGPYQSGECCRADESVAEIPVTQIPSGEVPPEDMPPINAEEATPTVDAPSTEPEAVAPEATPTSPQATPSPVVNVPVCSADMNVEVVFDSGSAILAVEGTQQLDAVATCIRELTEVVGYTDSSGSPAQNNRLSLQRAQAVVDYMVSQNPAMQGMLIAVGRGADNPIADNATPEGRAKNRRIEFLKKAP